MRATWAGVPQEIKDTAGPLLDKYAYLLPPWVRLLSVTYRADLEAFAEIESVTQYQRVNLTFGGQFLEAEDREWVVVHELVHTLLAPLERMWDEVEPLLTKRNRGTADRMFENALEESVSGLAHAIRRDACSE